MPTSTKQRGRPKAADGPMPHVSAVIPREVKGDIQAEADARGVSTAVIIRERLARGPAVASNTK